MSLAASWTPRSRSRAAMGAGAAAPWYRRYSSGQSVLAALRITRHSKHAVVPGSTAGPTKSLAPSNGTTGTWQTSFAQSDLQTSTASGMVVRTTSTGTVGSPSSSSTIWMDPNALRFSRTRSSKSLGTSSRTRTGSAAVHPRGSPGSRSPAALWNLTTPADRSEFKRRSCPLRPGTPLVTSSRVRGLLRKPNSSFASSWCCRKRTIELPKTRTKESSKSAWRTPSAMT